MKVSAVGRSADSSWKAARRMSHWMGSVSWNSSTSTTENRARSRARAAAPSCGWRSARCRRNNMSSNVNSRRPRLRLSTSARTASANPARAPAASGASRPGSMRAPGSLTTAWPMASAVARSKSGVFAPGTAYLRR